MRLRPAAITFALVAVLAALAAVATPAPASAAKPCWERVIDDWLDNGQIDGHYSVRCLQQARSNVQEDLRDYSNVTDVIDQAIQNDLRGGHQGSTGSGDGNGSSGDGSAGPNRHLQNAPPQSYYRRAIDRLGTTSADSLPIPLLVLAGLGTALLLSAGGLAVRRRLKARPGPPA